MVVNAPPIQEQTTDKSTGLFPQEWIRWFNSIFSRLSVLEDTVSNSTAFGETAVAERRPFIQAMAVYDRLPDEVTGYTASGGSAGAENRMFKVTTGTSLYGYGAIQSNRSLNYRPGIGALGRFTALFEGNVADSWQGVGFISIGDEFSFGYNGTSFGIWHRYNGLAEIRTLTITGAASGSENLTLTLNSVGYTIPLTAGTIEHNAHEISVWLNANQSVWKAEQLDDTVVISALSDGAKAGTYSFSSSTATGSIAQTTAGATKTSDFIEQASWNVDRFEGLNPTKGNVYQIQFQYLGFGAIKFFIENPTTGEFTLVHTIKYANKNIIPSIGNPSVKLGMYAASVGSTTDLVVRGASMGAFLEGKDWRNKDPVGFGNTQSVSTSFTNIIAFRNDKVYNGYINQAEVTPLFLSVASESSQNTQVELRLIESPEFGMDFTSLGADGTISYDVTSGTATGGKLLGGLTLSQKSSKEIDLTSYSLKILPGQILLVQGRVTSGASASITASLALYEDI